MRSEMRIKIEEIEELTSNLKAHYDSWKETHKYRDVVTFCNGVLAEGKEYEEYSTIVALLEELNAKIFDDCGAVPNFLTDFVKYAKIGKLQHIELRAEDYSDITKIAFATSHATGIITNYIFEPQGRPLYLIGNRGIGKTACTLKALSECDKTPIMRIFKKNNRVETLDNKIFGKTKQRTADDVVYVFDDIHYLLESVINKQTGKKVLFSFLDEIENAINKKKPVILLSDALMVRYAEKLDDKEVYDRLPRFGEFSQKYVRQNIDELRKKNEYGQLIKYIKSQRENIDIFARKDFPRLNIVQLKKMAYMTGRKIDNKTWKFIENNGRITARGLIAFLKEFKTPNITYKKVINRAKYVTKNSDLGKKGMENHLKILDMQRRLDKELPGYVTRAITRFRSYNALGKYTARWNNRYRDIVRHMYDELKMIQETTKNTTTGTCSDEEDRLRRLLNRSSDYRNWGIIASYKELHNVLKRNGKPYAGDLSFLRGWKGDYSEALDYIIENETDIITDDEMWKTVSTFKSTSAGLIPIQLLDRIFDHCFNEGSYYNEMYKAARDAENA